MSNSEEFYNAFLYSWDKNANEYMKKINMRIDNNLRVVYSKERIMKEVPPFSDDAYKYFYSTFNGPVCDSEHWKFFKRCFTYVYQKNGFIEDFNKNYSAFREYWNEHIYELNESINGKYKGNYIIVVHDNDLLLYGLTPIALQCFYRVFNGRVCDFDHWHYFIDCIVQAEKMTGNHTTNFWFIKKLN